MLSLEKFIELVRFVFPNYLSHSLSDWIYEILYAGYLEYCEGQEELLIYNYRPWAQDIIRTMCALYPSNPRQRIQKERKSSKWDWLA